MANTELNLKELNPLELLVHVPIRLYRPDDEPGPQHINIGRREYSENKPPLVVYPVEKDSRMLFGIYMNTYNMTNHNIRKTPEMRHIMVGRISPITIEVFFDVFDPKDEYGHYLGFEIHTQHDDAIPRYDDDKGERKKKIIAL